MIYAVAALAIAVFMIAFFTLHILAVANSTIATSREVSRVLTDPSLDNDHREQVIKQASLSLLTNFFSMTVRGALALALSWLAMLAADAAGLARTEDVISLLSSWQAILVTSVVLTGAWIAWKKIVGK